MSCVSCQSGNQSEFSAEMLIHFNGRKNIDTPGALIFPKILVCVDCGSSQFTVPETELAKFAE